MAWGLGEREPAGLRRADLQRSHSPTAARVPSAAASCPRSTRGCSAGRRATRSSMPPTPPGWTGRSAVASLDALRDLNEIQERRVRPPRDRSPGSPNTSWRIRMQCLGPRGDGHLAASPKHVLEAYGAQPGASSFANNCLLARRLVEQGVRFVQLFDWGWDFHGTGPGEGHPRRPDRRSAPRWIRPPPP